jgi:hypothetical protein
MLRRRSVPLFPLLAVVLVALAVLASACSGGTTVETGERPDLPRSAAATSPLPEVTVWGRG